MAQDLSYLLSERARLSTDIANLSAQLNYAKANSNPAIVAGIETRLASANELLAVVNDQIVIAQNSNIDGPFSTGEFVTQNRDDNANTQSPATEPTVLEPIGRINADNVETGTDAPVRTLEETQSTPQPVGVPFVTGNDNGYLLPGTPSLDGGTGAGNEDSGSAKNVTRTEIDNIFNDNKIVPQDNVLDQYASYTYSASVYLMKPEALTAMIKSGKKSIAGSQLLFQSGGAPVNGRNPYFTNDYYIDKIQLKSSIAGKGSNASHNVNTINMTLIEPNGITLLKNLESAVTQYLGTTGNPSKKKNFTSQLYLLVIRFYGYDDNGNLVQAGITNPVGNDSAIPGTAFVEKYYPMVINKINFKVANKLVEYDIEASSPKYTMNVGQMRGSIPYNVELSAMTVKEALSGTANVVTSNTPSTGAPPTRDEVQDLEGSSNPPSAPPTASAAPTPKATVRQGLIEAMNQFQQDLVKRKEYTYPDVYSVEFVSPSIEQAKIKKVGGDKKSNAMAVPTTAKQQVDQNTQSVDSNTRIVSAVAGTQLVQFIDQILKNCSYIEDQQLVKVLEDSGKQVPNGTPGKNLAWYKISLEATPGKYDPKRNDYAYNLKYIIHPYRINEMVSNYFAQPSFKGVHKQYNYWFTGENTQVLSYEQNYNALYTSILSGGPASPYSNQNDNVKFSWQTRSNESSQGAAGRANEPAANAADYLYNPGDLAIANLTIVGDPAWLQQGEAFVTPTKANFKFGAFLADGTINFESQQILFEILINTPDDYNFNTGVMDPNQRTVINASAKQPGASKQSYVYRANTIISEFSKGKFTQQLSGSLLTYFKDQSIKTAQDSGRTQQDTKNATSSDTASNAWIREVESTQALASNQAPDSDITPDDQLLNSPEAVNPQPASNPEAPTSDGDINLYIEQNETEDAGVNSESQLMDREA